MSKNKYARFFALLKQVNANGLPLTKEQAISDITKGRTKSLSDLNHWELQQLERDLSSMTVSNSGKLSVPAMSVEERKRDKMRKAIISQFLSIGRTAKDAARWAESYGVFGVKKKFNDYDEQELWQLIRNAENVKTDAIKAVAKKLKDGI
ncbi:hypothetical protein CAP35_13935 [Chitinophagaceae bacterium IBVUCB1]|nr:hypothetical protein CAP35_13935 [Chitinophagaceae bacterium IBVUCB1]